MTQVTFTSGLFALTCENKDIGPDSAAWAAYLLGLPAQVAGAVAGCAQGHDRSRFILLSAEFMILGLQHVHDAGERGDLGPELLVLRVGVGESFLGLLELLAEAVFAGTGSSRMGRLVREAGPGLPPRTGGR